MQHRAVQRVLIVGAGIGGIVAAIALQRAGIDVTVFERVKEQQEVGAGLSLWANAIRALQKIGLAEMLESIGKPLPSQSILSWQGDIISETPVKTLAERYGTPLIAVHRADLQAALLKAVGDSVVHSGVACTGFQQDETGVRVQLANGQEVAADLLLGADGIRSTIRAQMFGAAKPRYAGYTAWRGIGHTTSGRWNDQMATETWGNGRRFGLVPLSEGRIYWFATLNTPEGTPDPQTGRKQHLLKLFHTCHAPVSAVIEATDEAVILHNDIYDRPSLSHWSNGRVTLLGDAAHPMTPNMGQGACQAIEDAVTLATCLTTQSTIASALQAYEAQRLKQANKVVQRSYRIGQVAQWEQPLAMQARNTLFKMLPQQVLLKQLEWVLEER
ncbi:MAG TPA: FAD-dependent monooxygenase [Ktedonobacteraceae bacterium]|nr:FAD-dependent monooxygenase [Ktedonobacteraceae bacterium]